MRRLFLFGVLVVTALSANAQAPSIQWKKCFGGSNDDDPFAIQQTADGGYIVAGYSSSTNGNVTGNHGGEDVWVVKLDDTGGIQWGSAGSIWVAVAWTRPCP